MSFIGFALLGLVVFAVGFTLSLFVDGSRRPLEQDVEDD